MRKKLLLLMTLVLALTSLVGVARATPVDELTALAEYYPADTVALAAVRIDPGFIETVDGFVGQINQNLGGELLPPGFSVVDLLDQFAVDSTGRSFQRSFGAWFGDTVTAGILSVEGLMEMNNFEDLPLLIAAQVEDRAGLETALDDGMSGTAERREIADYILYEDVDVSVLLADDVVLFSNATVTLISAYERPATNLSTDNRFNATLDTLPADDYHAVVYLNAAAYSQQIMSAMDSMMQDEGFEFDLSALMPYPVEDIDAAAALGLTTIDGRSIVLDVASWMSDDMLAFAQSQPGYLEPVPVNPDFAAYIPADAQLVLHDNSFGPEFLAVIESLNQIGPLLQPVVDMALEIASQRGAFDELGPARGLVEGLDLTTINFGGALKQNLIMLFAGFTGLHLEDDVLSWMTGDYATYLNLIDVASDLPLSIDFGFVTEASDPEAAAAVVGQIAEAASLYDAEFTTEQIGGGETLVWGALRLLLADVVSQAVLDATPELDLLVGSNDDVFVVSTRPGAQFALDPVGDTLLDNPAYQYAAETLYLPDTVMIWFLNVSSFIDALVALPVTGEQEAENIRRLSAVLESATVTANTDGGSSALRIALTIPATQ